MIHVFIVFLSTPSARRATIVRMHERWRRTYFYPRPPRGGRRGLRTAHSGRQNFYPRPPRGGRPRCSTNAKGGAAISIHALREEGDGLPVPCRSRRSYFYPRPPRGGRQSAPRPQYRGSCYFYPRPPRGGRPPRAYAPDGGHAISIHALREEGDCEFHAKGKTNIAISIHALREEGDGRVHL
mgnify:CR=1 FL=1